MHSIYDAHYTPHTAHFVLISIRTQYTCTVCILTTVHCSYTLCKCAAHCALYTPCILHLAHLAHCTMCSMLQTAHTLYTLHCSAHMARCTMHTSQRTVNTLTMHMLHWAMRTSYTVQLHAGHDTMCLVHTAHGTLCILHSAQCRFRIIYIKSIRHTHTHSARHTPNTTHWAHRPVHIAQPTKPAQGTCPLRAFRDFCGEKASKSGLYGPRNRTPNAFEAGTERAIVDPFLVF